MHSVWQNEIPSKDTFNLIFQGGRNEINIYLLLTRTVSWCFIEIYRSQTGITRQAANKNDKYDSKVKIFGCNCCAIRGKSTGNITLNILGWDKKKGQKKVKVSHPGRHMMGRGVLFKKQACILVLLSLPDRKLIGALSALLGLWFGVKCCVIGNHLWGFFFFSEFSAQIHTWKDSISAH